MPKIEQTSNNSRNKNLEWFKHLIEILEKNNIWYIVDSGTLLGTIREKGPISWDDDFDIVMTPESYSQLKELYFNNCLDGTLSKQYPLIYPKFVPSIQKFLKSAIFVDIFLVVPTTPTRVKKFRRLSKKIKFATECLNTTFRPYSWYTWVAKILSYPIYKIWNTKITNLTAISILKANKNVGYYMIDNPIEKAKRNYVKDFSYDRIDFPFVDFTVKVPVEYDLILKQYYGNNYMIPQPGIRPFEHINAVSIRKKSKKEIKKITDQIIK